MIIVFWIEIMKIEKDENGDVNRIIFDEKDYLAFPQPKVFTTKKEIIDDINGDNKTLSPILNIDENEVCMSFGIGMGDSTFVPLKNLSDSFVIKTISEMYELGELVVAGEPFVNGRGSPLFQRLVLR